MNRPWRRLPGHRQRRRVSAEIQHRSQAVEGILTEERYLRQSELVVRCIPSIAEESFFAIKGGTAINLFELDLPRLSVDIDLAFLPVSDRDNSIREINAALVRISERLKARGRVVRMRGTDVSRKMACFANGAEIKIGLISSCVAQSILPVSLNSRPRCPKLSGHRQKWQFSPARSCTAGSSARRWTGSIRATFSTTRSSSGGGGTVRDVKGGFIALALGHNRPLHEILAPNMLDQSTTFDLQFAGMSDVPFSFDEHVATFKWLVAEIVSTLTPEDRERLVAFTALDADADAFGIPGLERLPAIQWKRRTLETLRTHNPKKFSENVKVLERVFAHDSVQA